MPIHLAELPYALDALEPHISRETLEYHYGKHHAGYVSKLNAQIEGSDFEQMSLEEIVRSSSGGLFNNAAQVWNHSFYWNCLSPSGGGDPDGALATALRSGFGSVDAFRDTFSTQAAGNFGSGWTWLVQQADGCLAIADTSNADTPLTDDQVRPLLTVDVWEHAYYIDYRNARPAYLKAFWELVNWDFVSSQLQA